jgi:hypothetical protein
MKVTTILSTIALAITSVHGHSYLFKPESRTMAMHQDDNGTMGCPPSDYQPYRGSSFQAGESIDVRYWRNNHIGGFIRWSMVPKGEESAENFNKNTFLYTCRESGPECHAQDDSDWKSSDPDFEKGPWRIGCGDKIKLPDWLPAGDYVLQWTWFAVGGHYGAIEDAEFTFRSCADIKLTEGKGVKPSCPAFVGGDRITKHEGKGNDVCFYIADNFIPNYRFQSDDTTDLRKNYHFGKPKEIEDCVGGSPAVQESYQTPETQAPETQAPETQAPETQAPETQAPETQAPETQSPEVQQEGEVHAPDEYQTPETQAPETQAPETKAPETQAPETQAPETQAPETQAPETEAPYHQTGQDDKKLCTP